MRPASVFEELSDTRPDPHIMFFKYLVTLALAPPIFAFIPVLLISVGESAPHSHFFCPAAI